jgi:hypothetical protein
MFTSLAFSALPGTVRAAVASLTWPSALTWYVRSVIVEPYSIGSFLQWFILQLTPAPVGAEEFLRLPRGL